VHRPFERPRECARQVIDADGVPWCVWEVVGDTSPGGRGAASLMFDSDTAGRRFRVWEYPPEWRELADEELLAVGGLRTRPASSP
jgi:hypothetical protein